MRRAEDWRYRAACLTQDPELFFPLGTAGPAVQAQVEQARQVCAACPVRNPCLAWALTEGADHGVWGGRTEDERRNLRRRNQRDQRLSQRLQGQPR